jgi:hypothetical protein
MDQLRGMGFDLNKLKRLYYIRTEIAEANGFSWGYGYPMKKFFDDLERSYDMTTS